MPSSWHPEALKSQAVAARSYARAARRSGAFDFYADTRDQVYGGRSAETAATNRAVRATARIHAVYDGKPITAFFHSSGEGYTESSAYVFSASPYLKPFGTLTARAGPSSAGSTPLGPVGREPSTPTGRASSASAISGVCACSPVRAPGVP